jgi:hypothetical protein
MKTDKTTEQIVRILDKTSRVVQKLGERVTLLRFECDLLRKRLTRLELAALRTRKPRRQRIVSNPDD